MPLLPPPSSSLPCSHSLLCPCSSLTLDGLSHLLQENFLGTGAAPMDLPLGPVSLGACPAPGPTPTQAKHSCHSRDTPCGGGVPPPRGGAQLPRPCVRVRSIPSLRHLSLKE